VVEQFLTRFRKNRMREGKEYRYHTVRTFAYLRLVWKLS
jgi:hypothetical protein